MEGREAMCHATFAAHRSSRGMRGWGGMGVGVGGGGGGRGTRERPVGGRGMEGQRGSLMMLSNLYSVLRHDARIKRPEGVMDCLIQVSQGSA
jgi:hypothetical protein